MLVRGRVDHRCVDRDRGAVHMPNPAAHRRLIADALAGLSYEHRVVIVRSFYKAQTTAQIAHDLQIAEVTVNSRLHCAMQALRRAVEKMG
jgi:RNA polymerase sigma-70 factor, ECF subfamily